MKVGDLVRYTPEGKFDPRWADWLGVVVGSFPAFMIVRWNKDNNTTLTNKIKDLSVVSESR